MSIIVMLVMLRNAPLVFSQLHWILEQIICGDGHLWIEMGEVYPILLLVIYLKASSRWGLMELSLEEKEEGMRKYFSGGGRVDGENSRGGAVDVEPFLSEKGVKGEAPWLHNDFIDKNYKRSVITSIDPLTCSQPYTHTHPLTRNLPCTSKQITHLWWAWFGDLSKCVRAR